MLLVALGAGDMEVKPARLLMLLVREGPIGWGAAN